MNIIAIIAFAAVCGFIAHLIGNPKGVKDAGIKGAVLGPLGVLWVLCDKGQRQSAAPQPQWQWNYQAQQWELPQPQPAAPAYPVNVQ